MRISNRVAELLARKERIERRRITRRDFATETGTSLNTVQSWLHNAITRYDANQILTYCQYFNVDVGELLVIDSEDESEGIGKTPIVTVGA